MALVFCDSFDYYAAAQAPLKWTLWQLSLTTGRYGQGVALSQGSGTSVRKTVSNASGATCILGFAVKFGSLSSAGYLAFVNQGGSYQITLQNDTTGHLRVYLGTNTALLFTGTRVLSTGVWYYVEFKVTIANSGGTVALRIDGVSDGTYTGDTQMTGSASWDEIWLGGNSGLPSSGGVVDDLLVYDGSGASENDWMNDCRIEAILPSGVGNSSVWLNQAGNTTNTYQSVDDATPTDDTDYVESATADEKDTYAYGNLATTSGTVVAVVLNPYWKKTNTGAKTAKSVARLSGGTEEDSAAVTLGTSYVYTPDVRLTKPGGGAWSVADVNAAEFGVKVDA